MDWEIVKPFISTEPCYQPITEGTLIIGFPFDGTTSFRPGTRFGPDALREASYGLEDYSSYLDKDLSDYNIYDRGNLPCTPSHSGQNIKLYCELLSPEFSNSPIKLCTIGGEHSLSFAPIQLYLKKYPDLVVIHCDAHADLRESYLDDPHSHASVIRRVVESMSPQQSLIQYGIRSGTKEEFQWMKKNQTLITSLDAFLQTIENLDESRPIYLTLDLDFFDPAFLPGTGTPEAGGADFHQFMKLVKILNHKNFVGCDIVELAPMIDSTGNSSCFAAKVTRELLLAMN